MEIDISKLSSEQLAHIDALITQQKKNEKIKRDKEIKAYELERDLFVKRIHNKAVALRLALLDFIKTKIWQEKYLI